MRLAGGTPGADTVGLDGAVSPGALLDELTALLDGSRHEARFILEEARGRGGSGSGWGSGSGLGGAGARPPERVPAASVAVAREMAARRAAGEPLQYVFGHWPFRTLDLIVDPRVLIPRPETEHVVEVALGEARRLYNALPHGSAPARRVVAIDAGTGSGAIALALAAELGAALDAVWATDSSVEALAVAAANLDALRSRHGSDLGRVTLARGSWLQPLPASLRGAVGLVVSNPPYVTEDEWPGLAAEVRAEPREALVSGPGSDGTPGLACVEAVLAQAHDWLARPGTAVVELAPPQALAAVALARDLGFDDIRVEPDLAGRSRALVARLAPAAR